MEQNSVCRQAVTVNLANGLHLRPMSDIAKVAQRSGCDLKIIKDEIKVDARNMLELMTLRADRGTVLWLEACGEGAAEVIAEVVRLFESNFDET